MGPWVLYRGDGPAHQTGLLISGLPSEKFAIWYVQAHLAGFELQVIATLATRVTTFLAATPRSMAKLSVIPLSLSRKWHRDLGVQAHAVQDHMLCRDPHLLNPSIADFRDGVRWLQCVRHNR